MNKASTRAIYDLPTYSSSEWNEFLEAGCYPYAINLKMNQFVLIGDFIGKTCTSLTSDEELIKTFKQELKEIFEIEVIEVDTKYKVSEGEKMVYIQREDHTGYYHLLRQDDDGKWSHKFPNELPIREDSLGQIIECPDAMVEAHSRGWCFMLRKES